MRAQCVRRVGSEGGRSVRTSGRRPDSMGRPGGRGPRDPASLPWARLGCCGGLTPAVLRSVWEEPLPGRWGSPARLLSRARGLLHRRRRPPPVLHGESARRDLAQAAMATPTQAAEEDPVRHRPLAALSAYKHPPAPGALAPSDMTGGGCQPLSRTPCGFLGDSLGGLSFPPERCRRGASWAGDTDPLLGLLWS